MSKRSVHLLFCGMIIGSAASYILVRHDLDFSLAFLSGYELGKSGGELPTTETSNTENGPH
jgi:hypothetical protein